MDPLPARPDLADDAPPEGRYVVAARKYRPQTFGELVAQDHVAQTLRNAVTHHRLAHAYLFSGPRGVGKTTAARLLAKAVNCQTPLSERDDAEPCRTCDACVSFEEGRALNVIEIDAASNRGVDDARELRETVRIPPQGARKKVYILDEVHMFTKDAFNVLLKTLEEPPAHALFIFATTEPHKVLPTILSRCQRFDFRRIAVGEIVTRLREIAGAEGVEADEEALMLIARRADGALRDALSLFDQSVALCGMTLDGTELRTALGVVSSDVFFAVTSRAAAHDRAGMLDAVERLVRRGIDLTEFVGGLTEHVRDLLAVTATGSTDLVEATGATRAKYAAAAEAWTETDLLHLLMVADEAAQAMREGRAPRLTLELALLRMASMTPVVDLDSLMRRLEAMGTSQPATPVAPSVARPAPTRQQLESPEGPSEQPRGRREPPRDDGGDPVFPSEPPPSRPAPPSAPAEPRDSTPADAPAAAHDLFGQPALRRRAGDPDGDASASGDGAAGAAEAELALPVRAQAPALPLGRVRDAWPGVIARVERDNVALAALLHTADVCGEQRGTVVISAPDAFARDTLARAIDAIGTALEAEMGAPSPPLRFTVVAPEPETVRLSDPFERLRELSQEHPFFRVLAERFGAVPHFP